MADENEAMAGHRVHAVVADLERKAHALDLTDFPEAHGSGERLREVAAHAQVRVAAAASPLVSAGMLERVAVAADGVVASIVQFETESNAAYLEQAAAACDPLLDALALLPEPAPIDEVKATRAAAGSFRTEVDELLDGLRGRGAELGEQLDTVGQQLDENKTTAAAEVQAVRDELEQMKLGIAEQTTRLEEALTVFGTQSANELNAAKTQFDTAASDMVEAVKSDGATALAAFNEERETASTSYRGTADAIIRKLQELRDQAANLVGVVTGTATAGHFMDVADKEKATADNWRKVTVVSVSLVVLIGIWTLVAAASDQPFGWDRLAAKAFVSIPLAALAGYAGQQSGEHRAAERSARHTQLQLAALEPFVESLGEEQAKQVRVELAKHLFGAPPAVQATADDAVTGPVLAELLERALQAAIKR